jgi:hypothetical protein
MGFEPERSRGAGGIEPKLLPPRRFIPVTVNFAMVSPAERNREFVTDLAAERPGGRLLVAKFGAFMHQYLVSLCWMTTLRQGPYSSPLARA